ncbi:MAG: hypothetical protein ACRD63_07200 [Pyrinomonadaceae bacterium]
MKKILIPVVLFVFIFEGAPAQSITQSQIIQASTSPTGQDRSGVRLRTPRGRRHRRVRRDRPGGRSIGSSYSRAGRSAGHGGAGFGKNIAKGKPIRAGKELGVGMGRFGKHTGIGTARVGKKIGTTTKHAVTP